MDASKEQQQPCNRVSGNTYRNDMAETIEYARNLAKCVDGLEAMLQREKDDDDLAVKKR